MEGSRPYVVTEYVDGPSLQQSGPRDGTAALQRLAVATATALTAIHDAGIVHRDFKPSNVLLGPDGPRVIDFGIARDTEAPLTLTSTIMGTPAYMAPEQFEGKSVGAPADVFAWGSVMAFAATGRPPFGADSFPAIMNRVLQSEPDLGDLPEPLRSLVVACLAKDPARRPTMQDVMLRLVSARSAATGLQPAGTTPPPPGPQTPHAPPQPPVTVPQALPALIGTKRGSCYTKGGYQYEINYPNAKHQVYVDGDYIDGNSDRHSTVGPATFWGSGNHVVKVYMDDLNIVKSVSFTMC